MFLSYNVKWLGTIKHQINLCGGEGVRKRRTTEIKVLRRLLGFCQLPSGIIVLKYIDIFV
jgi:hypothetical protein